MWCSEDWWMSAFKLHCSFVYGACFSLYLIQFQQVWFLFLWFLPCFFLCPFLYFLLCYHLLQIFFNNMILSSGTIKFNGSYSESNSFSKLSSNISSVPESFIMLSISSSRTLFTSPKNAEISSFPVSLCILAHFSILLFKLMHIFFSQTVQRMC